MQHESDEHLLDRARAGDRSSLETLLERHQGQIYRFGIKMCGDSEDAKDVLQDTMLAMARGLRDFRGASSISTWLYSIARSFCIKKRRKGQFAPEREHSLESDAAREAAKLPSSAQGPDDVLAGRQVERAIEQAIAALDDGQREVLILRDVEGLSASEVAEVLGIGVLAVKSRLHRARLAVRAHVAPLLAIPAEPVPDASSPCPDVLTLFSQHMEDEISPQVCAEMEKHLEGCGRCRGACDSLKHTLALCRTTGASLEVPSSVQAKVKLALRKLLAEP